MEIKSKNKKYDTRVECYIERHVQTYKHSSNLFMNFLFSLTIPHHFIAAIRAYSEFQVVSMLSTGTGVSYLNGTLIYLLTYLP